MRPIVGRRRAEQIEAVGAVEGPDDHEMREALNVGEPKFEFRQDAEDAFCVVLCAKALRNGGCIFVGTVYKSNSLRRKHLTLCLHFQSYAQKQSGCKSIPSRLAAASRAASSFIPAMIATRSGVRSNELILDAVKLSIWSTHLCGTDWLNVFVRILPTVPDA